MKIFVWHKTALNGFRQYNNKIKEITKRRNVYLIDLEKIVPKSLDYFYDDVHYNTKTYDLIAPYIAQEIKRIFQEK